MVGGVLTFKDVEPQLEIGASSTYIIVIVVCGIFFHMRTGTTIKLRIKNSIENFDLSRDFLCAETCIAIVLAFIESVPRRG